MSHPFLIDKEYSRRDIQKIIGIQSEKIGGNWATGYVQYKKDYFIFVNIATPGRTGHDHNNRLFGNLLYWEAKKGTKLHQSVIQKLLNPQGFIYFFIRFNNTDLWIFAGTGIHILHSDKNTSPVEIIWKLNSDGTEDSFSTIEFERMPQLFKDGIKRTQLLNVYERNLQAKMCCLEHYGCKCLICGFDFEKTYGDYGKGFIHVHHKKALSEIKHDYLVNPVEDLCPVCPNCHAMLHRQKPAITIERLKEILLQNK